MLLLAAAVLLADHAAARRLADRARMCLHWAGEEAYDKARARQIDAGMRQARCGTIERDAKTFLERRPAKADAAAVRKAIVDLT